MRSRSLFQVFILALLGNAIVSTASSNAAKANKKKKTLSPTNQPTNANVTPTPPNIFLIVYDDLGAAYLPTYAANALEFPNFKQFAADGMVFKAKTPYAVCGPSRNSILTGVANGVPLDFASPIFTEGFRTFFSAICPPEDTSCYSGTSGKVVHEDTDLAMQLFLNMNQTKSPRYPLTNGNNDCSGNQLGCKIASSRLSDTDVLKAFLASAATASKLKQQGKIKRVVFGVGYHRPHEDDSYSQNFVNPNDIPAPDTSQPIVASNGNPPLDHYSCSQWEHYKVGGKSIVPSWVPSIENAASNTLLTKQMTALYLNSVYEADTMLGKTLAGLNALGFDDTNSVFWVLSDHGKNYGEYNEFCKNTLRETVTRVVSMVKGLGIPKGVFATTLTSHVDLAPTLYEITYGAGTAANFKHPNGQGFEGKSLLPAFSNPQTPIDNMIFFRYGRCQDLTELQTNPCTSDKGNGQCTRPEIIWMGHGVTAVINGVEYTYSGWWPFNEVRTGCAKPTWPNQPAQLNGYGEVSWRVKWRESWTNFSVPPIQETLLANDPNAKYGEADYPNVNNLALMPMTKQATAIVTTLRNAIQARYPKPSIRRELHTATTESVAANNKTLTVHLRGARLVQ